MFPPLALAGMVHGGQQGVSGATIQLYAAGATGYASSATPLLTTTVTTNAAGSFTITGDYTCPTPSTQVYIVASGGNPGLSPGTNNTALAMMAALGSCGNLSASTFIFIDEVTTAASVHALAPFMAAGGGTKLGTSSTNSQGLVNAFATVGNLANTGNGTAPGPTLPSGATAPTSKLNTLADILAPCINSNGISGACSTLFTDATPSGGSAPTNAIDAMLAIAQHPAQNIAALFGLVTGTAPFQPTLAAAPNDWTLDIKYTGGGLTGPTMLAADATGNIWVANGGVYSLSGNGASGGANRISKFSATGSAVTGASGYTGGGVTTPFGLAIDPSGNVWTTNGSSTLSKFSSAGAAVSGAGGYTGGGLAGPYGIAINGTGFVWAANGTSLSEFQNGGTAQTGSPFGSGGTNYYCIAIDGSGNVWVTDEKNPGDVRELSSAGALLGTFSAGSQNGSWGVAIDSGAHVWIANSGNNSVTELTSAGALVSSYTGGGLNKPLSLAVDGLGNVWVANQGGNSVTELTNSGVAVSPTTGYNGVISAPFGIAVDSSGNVWVGNNASGSNSITEIVGAAAPVVTPLSVAVNNNKLGTRP